MVRDLDYRPDIEYPKKEAVGREAAFRFDFARAAEPHLQPWAKELVIKLFGALESVDSAISAAERQLAPVSVEIDPVERPELSEAIKELCPLNSNGTVYNDSVINYKLVRRACEERDNPRSSMILDEWARAMHEEDGLPAGELYEPLLLMREELVSSLRLAGVYIVPGLAGVEAPLDLTFDPSFLDQIDSAERGTLASLFESERRLSEMFDAGESGFGEFETILSRTRAMSENRTGLYEAASAVIERADEIQSSAGRARAIIEGGVRDAFGDTVCCFMRLILRSLDTSSADSLARSIDSAVTGLKSCRLLLRLLYDGRLDDLLGVGRLLRSQQRRALARLADSIAMALSGVRSKAVAPAVEWLEELVPLAEECLPFEVIGGAVMDAVDYVMSRYYGSVVDRLKLDSVYSQLLGGFLDSVERKHRLRQAMRFFDALVPFLEGLRDRLDFKERAEELIEEFARRHGFDTAYNPAVGSERLVSICP